MSRQPRVFISRTTAGLQALAERVAEVHRQRGIEPIIQTGLYPSTHDVKGMLAEHLQPQFTDPSGKKMSGKKWNPYFCHPCFCHHLFRPAFAPEPPELAQRQQTFTTEFAKDGRNTYGTFSQWDQPADPARGLKQAIEAIQFEITVLAGKPTNLPYTSLGTLFKGRKDRASTRISLLVFAGGECYQILL